MIMAFFISLFGESFSHGFMILYVLMTSVLICLFITLEKEDNHRIYLSMVSLSDNELSFGLAGCPSLLYATDFAYTETLPCS